VITKLEAIKESAQQLGIVEGEMSDKYDEVAEKCAHAHGSVNGIAAILRESFPETKVLREALDRIATAANGGMPWQQFAAALSDMARAALGKEGDSHGAPYKGPGYAVATAVSSAEALRPKEAL